ncbi:hypothetical protein LCGC14_2617690, partial [marine sediment metagenome]
RARGVRIGPDYVQMLKVTYEMIGLRPGRELRLAIGIAGTGPDWRCAMGHYVKTYPELFEPVPAARRYEGLYGIGSLARMTDETVETLKAEGVSVYELHGSFWQYGWWTRKDFIAQPDTAEFLCRSHPTEKMTVAGNRKWIRKLTQAGVAPIMYFYNVHAHRDTIEKHFKDDLFRDERDRPMSQYRSNEFTLRGVPESGYGKHVLEQADLMLKAYPEAPGFFLDNYSIHMVSFAHDDGVTMVRNRPVYDLNRNHQVLGPACMEKFHRAGKINMINKCMTIESARGADMVLAETRGLGYYKQLALVCSFRALLPLGWRPGGGHDTLERAMQHILVLGGLPDRTLRAWDQSASGNAQTFDRYRRLTDALIGKRWVFEPHPLTVPPPLEGQIFRIDKHAPRAGDVVVTLVDPSKSWKDRKLRESVTVTIAISDSAELRKATWLGVETPTGKPLPCKISREGAKL